ncbi:MAG: PQQ-dependent sugar dehydrogenase, partial [Pirellulaceae bacterium]
MRVFGIVVAFGCVLIPSLAAAAEPAKSVDFECRWATGPIEIDGKAGEAAWQAAQPIDRFSLPWLKKQARPAKAATRAKLLWDREALYFFAEMEDADLFADVTEHDGKLWDNDVFELFFKPSAEHQGYYEFQVNAAGTRLDMFLPERGTGGYDKFKADGPFRWQTAVARRGTLNERGDRDDGWSVEGRIPWSDLLRTGGRPVENEIWHFALCRYDYKKDAAPELSTCAPLVSQASFHHHEEYARLKFIPQPADPRLPPGLAQPVPLTTSRVVGSPDPPLPYRPVRAFGQLKLTYPIALDRVPGCDELLVIAQASSSGPTIVYRLHDEEQAASVVPLLETPRGGVAYGLCFHPHFASNGYLYFGWNGRLEEEQPKRTIVTRYTWNHEAKTIDAASALNVISWESDGHNGGDLDFGLDGMLYVTSGDGTSDSDTNMRGQDLTHLTAKVLRIDVDRPAPGENYSVPADNPFVGQPGIVPETWAYGLRNPWRLTVDPKTGHVWVGNNGQDLWEQVYFVRKGDNYGWSTYEGGHIFYAERKLGPHPHVPPAADHHHSEARSLTGGVVYHGSKLPELAGAYIYGDHSTGRIWGIKHDGTKVVWHKLLADTTFNISGFGLDSRGELLVSDHRGGGDGGYYYLEPMPATAQPASFPRKLSESGLFADVARHAMQPGVIPYSVNSPLWSDGAHKERFLAIPHQDGADRRIGYAAKGSWNFPDETVLVKSFALEATPGDAATRRWIETRFFTRQAGEWAGYSYRWNDDQTDAELVPAEGLDVELSGAGRKWRFPSRTECMVCHSRAANFVLGLTTAQLNREHDYGSASEHQFRTFERLGLLKLPYEPDATNFLKEDLRGDGQSADEAARLAKQFGQQSKQRKPRETALFAGDPHRYPRLPNPYDANEPLEARARSYLHVNCASCHVEAGGGNAQNKLDIAADRSKLNVLDRKIHV